MSYTNYKQNKQNKRNQQNKPNQSSYYTILDFPEDNKTFGKYLGSTPKNAAS